MTTRHQAQANISLVKYELKLVILNKRYKISST